MRKSSLIFFGLFLFSGPASADCGDSSLLKVLRPILQADAQAGDLWPGFRFTQEPIVMIDLAMNTCAHLLLDGQVVKSVPLSQAWSKATYGFDFVVNPKMYPNYPGLKPSFKPEQAIDAKGVWRCCELVRPLQSDLNGIMNQMGWPYALVYWMSNKSASYVASQVSTAAHETFHFFYQNRGLGGKSWPKPKFSSMDKHEKCYRQDSQVKALFQQELNTLVLAAQRMLKSEGKLDEAVNEFVRLRRLRYSMVKGLNCGAMESVRESIEGTAQFVGMETLLRLGMMTNDEFLKYLRDNLNSAESSIPYYFIGLAELSLIRHLQGGNFSTTAKTISAAGAPLLYVDVLADSL